MTHILKLAFAANHKSAEAKAGVNQGPGVRVSVSIDRVWDDDIQAGLLTGTGYRAKTLYLQSLFFYPGGKD